MTSSTSILCAFADTPEGYWKVAGGNTPGGASKCIAPRQGCGEANKKFLKLFLRIAKKFLKIGKVRFLAPLPGCDDFMVALPGVLPPATFLAPFQGAKGSVIFWSGWTGLNGSYAPVAIMSGAKDAALQTLREVFRPYRKRANVWSAAASAPLIGGRKPDEKSACPARIAAPERLSLPPAKA